MQKNLTYSQSIRFRRFLRKTYAVFCSLHKEISIGFLSVDTNKCSLRLLKKRFFDNFTEKDFDTEKENFDNILEKNLGLQPAFAVVLVSTQNNKATAAYSSLYGKNQRVKGKKITFNPFYFIYFYLKIYN